MAINPLTIKLFLALMKKIKPGEEFALHDTVYTYSVNEGRVSIKAIRKVNTKATNSFTPPTLEEVISFFNEKGYNEIGAKKAFDYYSAGDWRDGKGNQVKNWKQKMLGVWFRDEYKTVEVKKEKKVSNFFMKDED